MSRRSRSQSPKRYQPSCRFDEGRSEYELPTDASLNKKRKILNRKRKRNLIDEYIDLHSAKLDLESNLNEKCRLISDLTDEAQKQTEVMKNLKEYNAELRRELRETQYFAVEKEKLKEDNRKLTEDLAEERGKHLKFVQQLANTIEKLQNKVHITGCQNVQIGNYNTINDNVMSKGQELLCKSSLAINRHIAKRQELEMRIRNHEIMQKEMQDTLNTIVSNIKKKSNILREDKELLFYLTEDRSDERVILKGVEQLRKIKTESQKLPPAVHVMVERLLNKFGSITCGEFVQILDGQNYNSTKEIAPNNSDQTEDSQLSMKEPEFDNDASLDRSLCVKILSKWLQISDGNDSERLLANIEAYETKLSEGLKDKIQDEINSLDISNDMKEMQQQAEEDGQQEGSEKNNYSKSQGRQILPDSISQFMHQLEGLKIVIDIDRKVDRLLKSVAEPNRHDHNSRLKRSSVSSDV